MREEHWQDTAVDSQIRGEKKNLLPQSRRGQAAGSRTDDQKPNMLAGWKISHGLKTRKFGILPLLGLIQMSGKPSA